MYQDIGWVPLEPASTAPISPGVETGNVLTAQELQSTASGPLLDNETSILETGDTELAALAPENNLSPGDPSYMPPIGGEEDIIVVTGTRVGSSIYSYTLHWQNPPEPTEDSGTAPGVVTSSRKFGNPPDVDCEVHNPANKDAVHAEANKLMQGIIDLTSVIDTLPDFTNIIMADGSKMTALELKELWATIDFKVTDASPQPGRAGAYDDVTRTATFFLKDDSGDLTISGWEAWPNGLNFIMLHEVIHSSTRGQTVDQTQWDNFKAANPGRGTQWWEDNYPFSVQFEENEEYANVGARNIATETQLTLHDLFDPTNGYEYNIMDNDTY